MDGVAFLGEFLFCWRERPDKFKDLDDKGQAFGSGLWRRRIRNEGIGRACLSQNRREI